MRTILLRTLALGVLTGLAGPAAAQPEPGYTIVPAAERLTVLGVVGDASVEVKTMMALLMVGVIGAVAVWAVSLGKVGDARHAAGALGRLRIVRSGAAPLGFVTAGYVLLSGFIGISNVRPTPSLTVMAPGFAEATLAVVLGLLASAVAVICERHLEARIRRAAA